MFYYLVQLLKVLIISLHFFLESAQSTDLIIGYVFNF
jgi:hypothetical protein